MEEEEFKASDINFHDLYYKYANEQSEEIRAVAASCLHEGFLLSTPMEDIKKLQMAFSEMLEEDNKDVILALLPNMHTLIKSYCNEHAIGLVPEQAPVGDNTPTKGFALAHSNTFGGKMGDFSSLHRKYEGNTAKGGGFKKLTSMNVGAAMNNDPDELSAEGNYLISAEFKSEAVYQELLPKLLLYDEHMHGIIGLWRQHAEFICKFSDCFQLFH